MNLTHILHISLRCVSSLSLHVCQDYIHKVRVILHDSLQRESHNPYGLTTAVTWLQQLRKRTNTGTSNRSDCRNTLTYEHTTSLSLSPNLQYQPRIVNITCAWSWRLCGINRAERLCLYSCVHPHVFRQHFDVGISYLRPVLRQILSSASCSCTSSVCVLPLG